MYTRESASTEAKPRSKRGCLVISLLLFFGFPVLLIACAALMFLGRESAARRELTDRLEQLKAKNLPVDDATMADFYHELTSNDDSKAWSALLAELTSDEFNKSSRGLPIFNDAVPPIPGPGETWEQQQATREFLLQFSDLQRELTQLSLKQLQPGAVPVRYPTKWNSLDTLLPDIQNMRQASRLLLLQGQVAIYDENSASTRRCIEGLLGCSQAMSAEPVLVSQLVAVAIDSMAVELLQTALRHNTLNEKDLRRVLEHIRQQMSIGPRWRIAMQGERALMLPIYNDPSIGVSQGVASIPFRSRDALYYLDYMDSVTNVPTENMDVFVAELEKCESELEQLMANHMLARFDALLTSQLSPATSAAGRAFVRRACLFRLASLAVGVRLYEAQHAGPPASLADLGEFQLDPQQLTTLGGQTFGFQRDEEGGSLLWGAELEAGQVPAKPPVLDPTHPSLEQQRQWLWELPKQPDATEGP